MASAAARGAPDDKSHMQSIESALLVVGLVIVGLAIQVLISAKAGHGSSLRTKGDLHIRRKIQHAGTAVFFAAASHLPGSLGSALALAIGAASIALMHAARMRYPAANRAYMRMLGPILRSHEATQLPGAFYFVVGSAVAYLLFPLQVANLAVLLLGFGDPAASLFGVLLNGAGGKIGSTGKSVAGCVACFAVCAATTAVFMAVSDDPAAAAVPPQTVMLASVLCGAVGAAAELVSGSLGVDDNVTIPIVSGAMAWGVFAALGIPMQ